MHNVYSNINAKRIIKCFRLIALIFLLTTLGLFATASARSPILTRVNNDWSVSKVSPQEQVAEVGTIRGHVTASDGGSLTGLLIEGFGSSPGAFYASVDSSGNYEFIDIPAGTYRLLYGAYDFLSADDPLSYYIPEYYNNHLVGKDDPSKADQITVTANSVAVVDVELQLGAIITGTVTSNKTGEPLIGIGVIPHQINKQTLFRGATTDQNGQYELHGLPSGSYLLCFSDSGYAYSYQCLPETQPLVVTEGESIQANMTLILGATIQGKITSDQTGKGIPGVIVYIEGEHPGCTLCAAPINRRVATDGNGFYQFTGLPTDNYTLHFDGYSEGRLFGSNENGEPIGPYFSESYNNHLSGYNGIPPATGDPISITAGTLVTIDVGLLSALNVIGEIVLEPTDSDFIDPNIFVYDQAGQRVGESKLLENSNQFIIWGLSPGTYRIAFSDYLGDRVYPEYYNDKFTFEDADPISVTQGAVSNLVVTLTRRSNAAMKLATSAALTDVMILKTFDSANRYASLSYSNNGGSVWQSLLSEPWITSTATPDFDFVATLVPRGNETFPTRIIRASKTSYFPANNSEIFRTGDFGASWATFEPAVLPDCEPRFKHTYLDLLNSPVELVRIYMYAACFYYVPDPPLANSDKSATPTKETPRTADYAAPRPQLFTSNNAGIDWQEVSFPQMFNIFPVGFIVSPILPNRIYATGQIQGDAAHVALAQSDDAGVTWSTGVTLPVTYVEFDWHDSMKIYGIEDKDAFNYPFGPFGKFDVYRYTGKRSTDGGATWVDWQEQPCRTSFLKFMALQQPNTLLMHCLQGVYRSSNGGDHWEKLPETVDELIAVDYGNRNRIFGQRQGLLYASLDQGSTWTALGDWYSSMWLPFVSR